MEKQNNVGRLGLLLGISAVLVCGCSAPAVPPAAVEASPARATIVTPVVSINAVMVALIDPASHVLWNVEKEGGAPKTNSEWIDVEQHAVQLAAAGTLIAAGGTGQADAGWIQSSEWRRYARELNDAGLAASKAAGIKNMEALVKVNGQLVAACEGCHKQFKPDLPTEGIVHSH